VRFRKKLDGTSADIRGSLGVSSASPSRTPVVRKSMADENKQEATGYMPSDADKKVIDRVYDRFSKMAELRNRKYKEFGRHPGSGGNRGLIDFIDDSERRFMGLIPLQSDLMEEWQSRIFVNITRDIVVSWLAKVAVSGVKMKFSATDSKGRLDLMRTHLIDKLHDDSRKSQQERFTQFVLSMEGTVKGTSIAYEGYRDERRDIREITSYNTATGEVKYKKVEKRKAGCVRERVPLDEFYIGNPKQPIMMKQPDLIWGQMLHIDEAAADFSKFPKWSIVEQQNGARWTGFEEEPYYRADLYVVLEPEQCQVTRYYNRRKDEYIVIANGVLLYNGPMPFHHKEYPFDAFRFEVNLDLFWGNSLPNKFASNQDMVNGLWNMGLDRMVLSLNKPVITDDDEVIDTVWTPNAVLKVGDKDSYKEMPIDSPDQAYFSMLQLAQKFTLDNSGIIGGSSGTTPRGGKITARQALLMEEQAREIMGLSLNNLENFEAGCSKLRAQNILQFYALPDVREVVGKDGEEDYKEFIVDRSFRVNDTDLSDGTTGNVQIRIVDEKSAPTQEDVEVEEEVAFMQGENLEVLVVTPAYIRNMGIDVEPVPGSSFERSRAIEQEQEREFYMDMQANPHIDQVEATRDYVRSRDKDPEKLVISRGPESIQQGEGDRPPAGAEGQPPDLSTQAKPQPMASLGKLG